ncbi:MAG: hypothetical protein ACOVP1_02460 [Bacteroidia bacterium]
MKLKNILILSFVLILSISCKKGFEGTKKSQALPETFMVVDTIFRTGPDRLTTRVEAHWWGNSSGGFITAFEVSADNGLSWTKTKSQDSIFLMNIPAGQDSSDVVILVRAIDQLGQKDDSPASTLFPIKNSAPEVKFIFSQVLAGIPSTNPVNVFPVIKYNIQGYDPDGEVLQSFELFINDTNASPYVFTGTSTAFTLVATDPKADSSRCQVFLGTSTKAQSDLSPYIRLGAFNTIYIRAVDKALSKSGFIAAPRIWVKRVKSDLLVINAYNSSKTFVQNFYCQRLVLNGISLFDTLQATEIIDNNYTQLQPDFQTQSRTFSLFKKILWFSDDANFSLSLGQRSTSSFFDAGGKMFMTVSINSSFDPLSNFLDWTPIKSLVNPAVGSVFRVNINADVPPMKPNWPLLKSTAIIASARPFELPGETNDIGYDSLYAGGIIESKSGQSPSAWTGVSTVIARRYMKSTNKSNFIISSIPLERFNGRNNIDSLFNQVLINELGF